MIVHADDVILDAAMELLKHIPGLEDHVTADEEAITGVDDLPWCWAQLGDTDINTATTKGRKQRSLLIYFDLVVRARFKLLRAANSIAAAIENRIDANPRLGGLVLGMRLTGLTRGRPDETNVARVRMTYLVTYSTAAGAAETPV